MPDTTASELCQQLLALTSPQPFDYRHCRLPSDAAIVAHDTAPVVVAIYRGRLPEPLAQALHGTRAAEVSTWLQQAIAATARGVACGWIQALPPMDCFGIVDNSCCLDIGKALMAQNDKYQSLMELDEGSMWLQMWIAETQLQSKHSAYTTWTAVLQP